MLIRLLSKPSKLDVELYLCAKWRSIGTLGTG